MATGPVFVVINAEVNLGEGGPLSRYLIDLCIRRGAFETESDECIRL